MCYLLQKRKHKKKQDAVLSLIIHSGISPGPRRPLAKKDENDDVYRYSTAATTASINRSSIDAPSGVVLASADDSSDRPPVWHSVPEYPAVHSQVKKPVPPMLSHVAPFWHGAEMQASWNCS